ncbi:MAG: alkaline phosphatase family protein [Chloroflexota bacterium]|nr:alkaline phosphatase family protein [Chloroflexota bacterium]
MKTDQRTSSPVVIVGWDSASLDVIGPWLEAGELPNLQKLIAEGVSGKLRSTIHPMSGPAWASFMTGKNPGKHGIFDWTRHVDGNYDASLVNSDSLCSKTLWEIANEVGLTTGVINVPVTYPPCVVDGYLVSGLLTPSIKSDFTFPPHLADELHQATDGYVIHGQEWYTEGKEAICIEDTIITLEKRGQAVVHLLRTRPCDLNVFVFTATDSIQHRFWKYMDPDFPGYKPEYAQHADAVLRVFRKADAILGEILAQMPQDATVIVVSDHGAGPLYKLVFINRWLMELGLLKLKDRSTTRFKRWLVEKQVFLRVYNILNRIGLTNLYLRIPRSKRGQVVSSFLTKDDVDWSRTKAYATGDFGQIRINLSGREPEGIVSPGSEYEELVALITQRLYELEDAETGERIVDRVYTKDEIYSGECLALAPDLLFVAQEYAYISSKHFGFEESELMVRSDYANSGNHRQDGVFIAWGKGIKRDEIVQGAQITDVAPTALYLMGVPVPGDMDGRVLTDIFDEAYLADHPIQQQRHTVIEQGQTLDEAYSDQDADKVRRRLEALGYLG